MTKISAYNIDENVTADDKWIGTDVNTYNRTKNFTARKLSNYFNGSQVINTGVDLLYKYFTIDPSETRPTGTLTFETEIGPTVNFSAISTFLLSKTTLKGNDVVEFLNFLVGTKILLYKAKNINLFGNYKIVSVEESLPEPNFFIVNLEFIDGNGFIEEDEDYMISLIDINNTVQVSQLVKETFDYESSNSFTLNNLINNVLQVIVNTTSLHPVAYSYTLPRTITVLNDLYAGDVITVVYNCTDELLDIPDLQRVTDVGSVTTNSITADAFIKSGGVSTEYLMADGNVSSDILLKKTGDTMLGDLILNEDPSTALGAATKQYVDNIVSGINFHPPVVVATDVSLVATYDNGADGVGATLTGPSVGVLSIDGEFPTYLDRILVWQQADPIQNGVYDLTTVGDNVTVYQLTRSSDADNNPLGEIHYGDYTLVLSGDTNSGFGFICNTPGVIDIGTTPITYIQFNAAQAVTAGYGLQEAVSNVISIDPLVTQEKIILTTTGSGAATLVSNTLNIPTLPQATTSVSGYLSSTDWNTFNGKANVNSQVFTGTPSLPTGTTGITQTAGTNNTTLATTAFATTALNGKMNNPSLTASYIPRALTATTIGNSRLWDTGTKLGIGTNKTPTEDITFGNQDNRTIGIEQSSNTNNGRDLILKAGRTINFVEGVGFQSLNTGIVAFVNGSAIVPSTQDVYVASSGNIYKRTSGAGPFVSENSSVNAQFHGGMGVDTDGSVYLCVATGGFKKKTNNTGSWVQTAATGTSGTPLCIAGDYLGNLYLGTDVALYKQTGLAGSFVSVYTGGVSSLTISPIDGSIYIITLPSVSAQILKQTAGTGSFDLVQSSAYCTSLCASISGDVFVALGGTILAKQTAGSGLFASQGINITPSSMASDSFGSLYAPVSNSDIFFLDNNAVGSANLDGGFYKNYAGTGKGTGRSRWQVYTGQKTTSGTNLQAETLRMEINEDGLATLPSVTNALIEADTTGKAVVTKEYVGLAKSFAATGTVTTTFTVTIGTTQANNTYKVVASPSNALSAVMFYINNKTTTTFDVVFVTALTGAVAFDWILKP